MSGKVWVHVIGGNQVRSGCCWDVGLVVGACDWQESSKVWVLPECRIRSLGACDGWKGAGCRFVIGGEVRSTGDDTEYSCAM